MKTDESGRAFYGGLLEALTQVMGFAKGYLADHSPRVALLSAHIADAMGLSRKEVSRLFFASVLSDMGMVGLAEDAWDNPVPELPPETRARVERHPVRSEEQVAQIPHLEELAPLIRHHHEWWDGSGYPDGLSGSEIPVGAQILRLADTVSALGQFRPQRGALGREEILEVVRRSIGREFGPEVAETYLALEEAGDVPGYNLAVFRHAIARASEHVLPEEVSPLSSDQLLAIVANLIDAKDTYTGGHSRRVATLSVAVAAALGLQDPTKATLWSGGYLHDLGKLRIPLRILAKHERLTPDEFEVVKSHPTDGAAVLEGIPALRHLTTGARYHHERWDGSGYPEGLKGDHIPLVGQILAVCDAYDAMTSTRSYRDSRSHADALKELERCSGVHFSPRVTDAFVSLPTRLFEEIRSPRERTTMPFAERAPLLRHRPAPRHRVHAAAAD